jgi:hypothetical protein
MPATIASQVVANQVFVGCPWRGVRPKYESVFIELRRRFPVNFIIVGT